MKKRIGNDFSVSWSISRIGEPESFEPDMPIRVLILNMSYGWVKIEPIFHVVSNVISFTVPADKQQPGRYRVMLQYQKKDVPNNHIYTVDVCNAFELVSDSCNDEISEGDVSLSSDVRISQDGKDGLNTYQLAVLIEGFEGSLEEYLQSIRQPAIDAANSIGTLISDLTILEKEVSNEEKLRVLAETKRGSDFTYFLSTSADHIKTEVDKVATAVEEVNTAKEGTIQATGEALAQANYAKEQADAAKVVVESAGADPLLGKATTLRTNTDARSTCNLYNFQKGVTYAVAFIPDCSTYSDNQRVIDCTSYKDLNYYNYPSVYIRPDGFMILIPANYGGNSILYNGSKVMDKALNLFIVKIWDNSVATCVNGRNWRVYNISPETKINYPAHHQYGFSPIIIDALTIGLDDVFVKINSFREFDFLITDEMKDALWNNGRPDQVVIDSRINNDYPVLPLNSVSVNGSQSSKTEIEGGWRFTGWADARFDFSGFETAQERYVLVSFKYRSSDQFKAENQTAAQDKITYTFEASDSFKEARCLATLGNQTHGRFQATHTSVGDQSTAFLEIIDFEYKNAVCTGEYLASGFRKNRLIDTSSLKRNIEIAGNITLHYQKLYDEIIYKVHNPDTIPQFTGQRWFNTTSKTWLIAYGTSSNADWVTLSGAKATSFKVTTDENNIVTNVENIYQEKAARMMSSQNVYIVTELPSFPVGQIFDGETWTEIKGENEI